MSDTMADTAKPKPTRARRGKKKPAKKTPAPVKPTTIHTKRKEIEGADGWIHIVDKPRTNQFDAAKVKKQSLQGGDFELKGVSYIDRTLVEMTEDFEHWKRSWVERPTCQALKEKLKDVEKERKIENVVVLGLGSLQSARREGRRSSATQLAALQTIVDGLQRGSELQVVFQDPQFTRMDKEFLTMLGYKVVDDPEAFKVVGKGSLVYAIHCYAQVYKSVAERPRPAVLIGTNVENFARFDASEDTTAKDLEKMVEGYEVFDFPQLRHDFSDTKIYLRSISKIQNAREDSAKVESAPMETNQAEPTPAESAPAESAPAENTPAETTQAEPTEAKTAEAESIPAETTKAETTPVETAQEDTTSAKPTTEEPSNPVTKAEESQS